MTRPRSQPTPGLQSMTRAQRIKQLHRLTLQVDNLRDFAQRTRGLVLGTTNFVHVATALVRMGVVEEQALLEAIRAEREAYAEQVRDETQGDGLAVRITRALCDPLAEPEDADEPAEPEGPKLILPGGGA